MTIRVSRLGGVLACVVMGGSTVGCATVTRGTSEAWTVKSWPIGAAVTTSNGFSCDQTPCTFKMKRKSEFDVAITKDGYKPYHGHVIHHVGSGGGVGMAGNVLVGGLIGAGVDESSGAMEDLTPNPMIVELEKVDEPTPTIAVAETPGPANAPSAPAAASVQPPPAAPAAASPATDPPS